MDIVAERWVRKIEGARADGAKVDHYIEVKYESLVQDTEPEDQRISSSSELPWDPSILTYYERAEERLAEMVRDLPGDDGKPMRPAPPRGGARPHLPGAAPQPARALEGGRGSERNAIFESIASDLLEGDRLRGGDALVSSTAPLRRAGKGAAPGWAASSSTSAARRRRSSSASTRSGTTLLRMMLHTPQLTCRPRRTSSPT